MTKSLAITLSSLLIYFSLATASSARACSPPQPAQGMQDRFLKTIDSKSYKTELNKRIDVTFNVAIQKVEFSSEFGFGGKVFVSLTDGCVIKADVLYDPPRAVGLCPTFKQVIAATDCSQ